MFGSVGNGSSSLLSGRHNLNQFVDEVCVVMGLFETHEMMQGIFVSSGSWFSITIADVQLQDSA